MEYPSLSHLINVGLKSTLSEISMATPAVFKDHWLGKSCSSLSLSANNSFKKEIFNRSSRKKNHVNQLLS
jgi:hypothetical protein